MKIQLVALLAPVLALARPRFPTVVGPSTPNPNEIQIVSAQFSGSGCPQGSVSTTISPDRTVITFGFDRFQTYIGPGIPFAERTKNCNLHLNLRYPSGFQFAVVESTYHGFAQLDQGGGGIWKDGQVYTKQDVIPTAALIWAQCGASGILNVNNRINLVSRVPSAYGSITDDDATVAFTQQVNVKWQKC
ncbi:putative secreted protein like [Verticillium longisporum]|uniref:Putative secreted protein like n=1 Tax=Verticillium longisporum TaxID=100787 RepID=A0A8I3AIP8_VERLO|nr:putative secreted protein like [Verticillium longisporum]